MSVIDQVLNTFSRLTPLQYGVLFGIISATAVVLFFAGVSTFAITSIESTFNEQSSSSLTYKLKTLLDNAHIPLSVSDFITISLIISTIIMAISIFINMVSIGIMSYLFVPFMYYHILANRYQKIARVNRYDLSIAVDEFADAIKTLGNIPQTIVFLTTSAPVSTRHIWQNIYYKLQSGKTLREVLEETAAEHPRDIYWRQIFDIMAKAEEFGGNLSALLHEIAFKMREHVALLDRIDAQQSGYRTAAIAMLIAPSLFMIFSGLTFGESFREFYKTIAGQITQVIVAMSGLLAWYLINRIGQRGLLYTETTQKVFTMKESGKLT